MFDSKEGYELGDLPWPDRVPPDLELRLLDAMSYRKCGQHDIWGEVKAWLEENGVDVTEQIARIKPSSQPAPRGCTKYNKHNKHTYRDDWCSDAQQCPT